MMFDPAVCLLFDLALLGRHSVQSVSSLPVYRVAYAHIIYRTGWPSAPALRECCDNVLSLSMFCSVLMLKVKIVSLRAGVASLGGYHYHARTQL
jgi:hypothetical protein